MKKFLSLILALVMALSLTTVAWGAEEEWYGGSDPASAAKLSEYLTNNTVADGTTINLTGAYYDLSLPAGTTVPKNLTIVGGGQNATPVVNCFIGADVDGLTLKNIWFMAGGGITGNSSGSNAQVIKNMTVDGCFFEGSQAALNLGSGTCENMTIKNCKFLDTPSSNAIRLYNVSGTTTITGNEIAQAPSYGVALLDTVAGTVNIDDNAMANITKGALRVDQIQAGAVVSIAGNGKIADTALANGQVMKITSVAPGATVSATGIPSGAKTLVEEGNVTLTDGFTGLTMDANKKITGGTFATDVSAYVADDYVQGGDGSVVTPVAQVGSTKYATLAEAVAAAADGGTVKLLADSAEDVTVGKALTFDFNGYTYTGFVTPAAGYTYMDGVVKKTPAASGTTSTGSVTSGTVTPGKAKLYLLATAGTSMTELGNVTKIEMTTVSGKLVNDVPVYVPDIYKLDGVYYVEVAKADATYALKNNGAYVYLAPAGAASDVNAVIAKFATTVVLDKYVAAAETVECGDAVKGTKGAAIYMSGDDAYYADGSNWAVFKGEFVTYDKTTKVAYKEHKWDAKSIIVKATDVKGVKVPVTIECEDCEKTFSIVPSAKFDNTWVMGVNYTVDPAVSAYGQYYIVLTSGTSAPVVTPSTDKVQSAETFDAGIAMYVGMSVMAATGSAVVLKKREH